MAIVTAANHEPCDVEKVIQMVAKEHREPTNHYAVNHEPTNHYAVLKAVNHDVLTFYS
jgi:hypothetical protein